MSKAYNWVRYDCAISRNDKILALIEHGEWRAIALYGFALGHCREQKTAGFVSRAALPMLHGRPRDAAALVRERLWEIDPGGWMVHDWSEHQETDDEIEARSRRARAAAAVRWGTEEESGE